MEGSSDLYTRARATALEIIEAHRPEPLDADVAKRLRVMVEDADRRLAGASSA
jgi:trimethylamine:corrinoid methyltransferase-like protein